MAGTVVWPASQLAIERTCWIKIRMPSVTIITVVLDVKEGKAHCFMLCLFSNSARTLPKDPQNPTVRTWAPDL